MAKTIKAFVASASDCDELRASAKKILDRVKHDVEDEGLQLNYFMWEHDVDPKYYSDPAQFQNDIFTKFGEECEFFILIFWHKLGLGTKLEFEYYEKTLKLKNSDCEFICCHYSGPMTHDMLQSHKTYYKLVDFLKKSNISKSALLGKKHGEIKTIDDFEGALSSAINKHLVRHRTRLFS